MLWLPKLRDHWNETIAKVARIVDNDANFDTSNIGLSPPNQTFEPDRDHSNTHFCEFEASMDSGILYLCSKILNTAGFKRQE